MSNHTNADYLHYLAAVLAAAVPMWRLAGTDVLCVQLQVNTVCVSIYLLHLSPTVRQQYPAHRLLHQLRVHACVCVLSCAVRADQHTRREGGCRHPSTGGKHAHTSTPQQCWPLPYFGRSSCACFQLLRRAEPAPRSTPSRMGSMLPPPRCLLLPPARPSLTAGLST